MVGVTALCCDDEGEQRSMSSDDPACVWKKRKKKDFNRVNRISVYMYVTSNKRGHNEGIDKYGTTTEQLRNNYGRRSTHPRGAYMASFRASMVTAVVPRKRLNLISHYVYK